MRPGLTAEREFEVGEDMTAPHVGSGSLRVLSTPCMIAFMEETCRLAVEPLLGEGETTVGTRVDVAHVAPAPLGARVRVRVRLERVEGRRLLFRVEALWGERVIGRGSHERFVVDTERFLSKLRSTAENDGAGGGPGAGGLKRGP